MTFLFAAYKPDSTEYGGGTRIGSYSSNFVLKNNLTQDQLVEVWADILFKNKTLDYDETGYEIHVFKDGIKVFTNDAPDWDRFAPDIGTKEWLEESRELDKQEQESVKLMNIVYIAAKFLCEQLLEKHNLNKAAKQIEAKKADYERKRKQFEELKKELGES